MSTTFLDIVNNKFNSYVNNKDSTSKVFIDDQFTNYLESCPYEKDGHVINQKSLFKIDFSVSCSKLMTDAWIILSRIAHMISILALSPFAIFIDLYRVNSDKEIKASILRKDLVQIPKYIFGASLFSVLRIVEFANHIINTASQAVGFLVWHGGEAIIRHIRMSGKKEAITATVLSHRFEFREIVYRSIGVTLLAAGALFVPVLAVQLVALPIILGSVYGTINNQFTVRECPEYYTMGHHYDGTSLEDHAIRTNHLAIKPIVTGCYATTFVTKIAGAILGIAGVAPFVTATLPLMFAAAMVGSVVVISLVAAHLFAIAKKRKVQKSIEEYAKLLGLTVAEISPLSINEIKQKDLRLEIAESDLEAFLAKAKKLEDAITLNHDLPLMYASGWATNNARNTIGYASVGIGTIALTVATVCLRILVL